jgi:hypothetical protein
MVTTERKSIEKSERAETTHNEKPGFAELWRTAQQRRSAYIGSWIARIFRQSRPWTKFSEDIRATPPLRHVNSPR